MADEDQTLKEAAGRVTFPAVVPGPPVLPVNSVGINAGAFDITLDLAYQVGAEPAQITARVAMSYEHAQILARVLQRQVDAYVEKVGPIPDLERVEQEQEAR